MIQVIGIIAAGAVAVAATLGALLKATSARLETANQEIRRLDEAHQRAVGMIRALQEAQKNYEKEIQRLRSGSDRERFDASIDILRDRNDGT